MDSLLTRLTATWNKRSSRNRFDKDLTTIQLYPVVAPCSSASAGVTKHTPAPTILTRQDCSATGCKSCAIQDAARKVLRVQRLSRLTTTLRCQRGKLPCTVLVHHYLLGWQAVLTWFTKKSLRLLQQNRKDPAKDRHEFTALGMPYWRIHPSSVPRSHGEANPNSSVP